MPRIQCPPSHELVAIAHGMLLMRFKAEEAGLAIYAVLAHCVFEAPLIRETHERETGEMAALFIQASRELKGAKRDLEGARADNLALIERLRFVQGYQASSRRHSGSFYPCPGSKSIMPCKDLPAASSCCFSILT